jgi:HYR domain-containing protein
VHCIDSTTASSCNFFVQVNDTSPPVISCPGKVSAVAPQNTCSTTGSATVNYATPTAVDACQGPVPVSCSPPSGSLFPLGTTTVTCIASDQFVNIGVCTFPVSLSDVCLQDDSNPGTALTFNSATGDYKFCCGGSVFTGKGTVTIRGCTITLQHTTADRRVSVTVDKNSFRGSATLQSPPGNLRCGITDRDIRNSSCNCN